MIEPFLVIGTGLILFLVGVYAYFQSVNTTGYFPFILNLSLFGIFLVFLGIYWHIQSQKPKQEKV